MANRFQWDNYDEQLPHHDVVLLVEDKKFYASKGALAQFSNVFSMIFYGSSEEASKKEIPLAEKKAEEILELLRVLLLTQGVWKKVDHKNVALLSKLAYEYEITHLSERCTQFLQTMHPDKHTDPMDTRFTTLFLDGVKYGQKNVVRASLPVFASRTSIPEMQSLAELPAEIRCALYVQQQCASRTSPWFRLFPLAIAELEKIGL